MAWKPLGDFSLYIHCHAVWTQPPDSRRGRGEGNKKGGWIRGGRGKDGERLKGKTNRGEGREREREAGRGDPSGELGKEREIHTDRQRHEHGKRKTDEIDLHKVRRKHTE